MLKSVLINNKKIPVPVPIMTLDQALTWVEEVLVQEGHTITRIELDGRVLTDGYDDSENLGASRLTKDSILILQIDSPIELAIQTIEAIRNLASVVNTGIKKLAVDCWQAKPIDKPEGVDDVSIDVELVLELLDHSAGIIDPTTVETAAINGIATLLKRELVSIQMAISNSDWRAAARILLNRLEPLFNDLIYETEELQIKVRAIQSDHGLAKAGS